MWARWWCSKTACRAAASTAIFGFAMSKATTTTQPWTRCCVGVCGITSPNAICLRLSRDDSPTRLSCWWWTAARVSSVLRRRCSTSWGWGSRSRCARSQNSSKRSSCRSVQRRCGSRGSQRRCICCSGCATRAIASPCPITAGFAARPSSAGCSTESPVWGTSGEHAWCANSVASAL